MRILRIVGAARQANGYPGVPGRPVPTTWPVWAVEAVLKQGKAADARTKFEASYGALRAEFDKVPFGDRAAVVKQAEGVLKAVKGDVWLTETGGIVKFVLPDGRTLFPFSESRANRATKRMFALAKRYRSRIKRLYIYHWKQPNPADPNQRFDAGLIRYDGSARPAYRTVRRALATRTFNP